MVSIQLLSLRLPQMLRQILQERHHNQGGESRSWVRANLNRAPNWQQNLMDIEHKKLETNSKITETPGQGIKAVTHYRICPQTCDNNNTFLKELNRTYLAAFSGRKLHHHQNTTHAGGASGLKHVINIRINWADTNILIQIHPDSPHRMYRICSQIPQHPFRGKRSLCLDRLGLFWQQEIKACSGRTRSVYFGFDVFFSKYKYKWNRH